MAPGIGRDGDCRGTAASYTVVAADEGATLKVEVSFTDDDGTGETVESAPTSAAEAPSSELTVAARVGDGGCWRRPVRR